MIPDHIRYFKRLTQTELLPLLLQATMVICRSGYSTLMDLTALGKKAIVIPTPGQTEQQYLARHLHREGFFFHAVQKKIDIMQALSDVSAFPFRNLPLQVSYRQHESALEEWLKQL